MFNFPHNTRCFSPRAARLVFYSKSLLTVNKSMYWRGEPGTSCLIQTERILRIHHTLMTFICSAVSYLFRRVVNIFVVNGWLVSSPDPSQPIVFFKARHGGHSWFQVSSSVKWYPICQNKQYWLRTLETWQALLQMNLYLQVRGGKDRESSSTCFMTHL